MPIPPRNSVKISPTRIFTLGWQRAPGDPSEMIICQDNNFYKVPSSFVWFVIYCPLNNLYHLLHVTLALSLYLPNQSRPSIQKLHFHWLIVNAHLK